MNKIRYYADGTGLYKQINNKIEVLINKDELARLYSKIEKADQVPKPVVKATRILGDEDAKDIVQSIEQAVCDRRQERRSRSISVKLTRGRSKDTKRKQRSSATQRLIKSVERTGMARLKLQRQETVVCNQHTSKGTAKRGKPKRLLRVSKAR